MENKKKIAIIAAVLLVVLIGIIIFLVMQRPKTVYTVSFNSDGGKAVSSVKVEDGKTAEKPKDPTKDGYEFVGWYIGDEKYDFSKPVSSDVSLTAKWNKLTQAKETSYTITLNIDGKKSTVKTNENGVLKELEAPTKDGYKFLGWYAGDKKVDFTKPFTADTEITAKWEKEETKSTTDNKKNTNTNTKTNTNTNTKTNTNTNTNTNTPVTKYTVTFNSNGGSSVSSQTVEKGKTASKPEDPTRSGYTFKGWYLNGTAYNFSSAVNSNITLTANWEQIKVVKIEKEEIPNDTARQIRIYVTLNGTRVNGTVTKTSKASGKAVTISVPKEGLLINKDKNEVSNPQVSE